MTDHKGRREDVVALMYEIGGRYRQGDDRREFEVYADDLAEKPGGGPVSEDAARLAYRARRDGRNDRRGGGS